MTTIHDMVHRRDERGDFALPRFTLGWQALHRADVDGIELSELEKREVLWSYAIDELGEPLFDECLPDSVLRVDGVRGHLVFGGWASRDMPEVGVSAGEPLGFPEDEHLPTIEDLVQAGRDAAAESSEGER